MWEATEHLERSDFIVTLRIMSPLESRMCLFPASRIPVQQWRYLERMERMYGTRLSLEIPWNLGNGQPPVGVEGVPLRVLGTKKVDFVLTVVTPELYLK